MDAENHVLTDYRVWRLYLEEANKGHAEWKQSYSFKQFYNVNDMSLTQYEHIVNKLQNDQMFFNQVMKIRYSEGPAGFPQFEQGWFMQGV